MISKNGCGILRELLIELQHDTKLFPEDSNETVTVTAGGVANTFSAWTELVDNNAVSFSSKIADQDGHISNILLEAVSATDKIYILELSCCDDNTIITRARWIVNLANIGTSCAANVRSVKIPAGETVYYRLKCETGGATAEISLRYHTHE